MAKHDTYTLQAGSKTVSPAGGYWTRAAAISGATTFAKLLKVKSLDLYRNGVKVETITPGAALRK